MTIGDKDRVLGVPLKGSDEVLSQQDDDLTIGQSWHDKGFSVHSFLSQDEYKIFFSGFVNLFKSTLRGARIEIPESFVPGQYHRYVADDYKKHLLVIKRTKLFEAELFPVDIALVEARISKILGFQVKSIKPFNSERVFHFRVIRPGSTDYNPLHRDVWQEENRDAINIYVPMVGSNEKSSLLLIPGSHLWQESWTVRSTEGAEMNGIKFNVPGLITSQEPLELVRPNPQANEVLVFSPYLLHGLSANGNADETRISLEMRFWRV